MKGSPLGFDRLLFFEFGAFLYTRKSEAAGWPDWLNVPTVLPNSSDDSCRTIKILWRCARAHHVTSQLEWNPHVSDEAMVANLKTLVERMGELTGRHVVWKSADIDDRGACTT